jgi:capsular polysaccharide biosynthesis protein
MSQQALDLRRSMQIVRRHKIVVSVAVLFGLVLGVGYVVLNPPKLTAEALVVVPVSGSASANPGVTQSGVSDAGVTDAVIASSDPVLAAALPQISPPVRLADLETMVKATALTDSVIAIDATSKSPGQALSIANAVAASYVAYVSSPTNPGGAIPARVLEAATTTKGSSELSLMLVAGVIGAIAGAFVGFVVAVTIGRKDRRLRQRDEIANAVGIPVIASVPAEQPSDAAAWTRLLENYAPAVAHGWQLRNALQHIGKAEAIYSRNGAGSNGISVTVMSFSSDRRALALGPQLAAFAAASGISTALVMGPRQDAAATATLRTACSVPPHNAQMRGRPLRVAVADADDLTHVSGAALVVRVVVIDDRAPSMPDTTHTTLTLLAVSAGATTGEQLARAATIAAEDGRDVTGILVADPDPADQTTGRVPQLGWTSRRLPNRLNGSIPTEIKQ